MMFMAVLGVGLGVTALVTALTRKASAAPEEYIPTEDDIASCTSLPTLDAYHDLAAEQYITGIIDQDTYQALYSAYETRYYEILEAE